MKNLGSNNHWDAGNSVRVGPSREIYVAGKFNYQAVFGTDTLQSLGHDDIMVLKLDSNGNHIWVSQAGGSTNDGARSLFVLTVPATY